MCESSVWLRYPDGRTEKIADDVLVVTQEGGTVVLRWFLAEPRRVAGTIQEVDAVKHVITLNAPETPGDNAGQPETAASLTGAEAVHSHPHPHPHR